MLPSRGLRWTSQSTGLGRRRLYDVSTRSLSYSTAQRAAPRTASLFSDHGASLSNPSCRPQIFRTSPIIPLAASIRYHSTTPLPSQPSQPSTASSIPQPEAAASTLPPTPVEPAFDVPGTSIHEVPETIGYLQSLGLDYGWGPTTCVEWLLEHVHVYAGTPWWCSIALTAVIVRIILLKPYMGAADNAARLATIQPVVKPMMEKMHALSRKGDSAATMAARRELQIINRRAGVKLWKSFVPMVQVFVGYGTFVLLRGMAKLPVPGLETGGALWFSNLAIADPTCLLPLLTAAILHLVLRRGGETGVNNVSPSTLKLMSYGFPALSLVATAWLPAGLQLSFLVSGLASAAQATVFRNAAFRSFAGMTPMPKISTNPFDKSPEPESPYQPRVVVAPKGSYRATPAYQAPRSAGAKPNVYGTDLEPNKGGIFGGLKKGVEGMRKGLQENLKQAQEKMGAAGGGTNKDGKRSKQDIQRAAAYEKKRSEEEKLALQERDEKRRAERMARRSAK